MTSNLGVCSMLHAFSGHYDMTRHDFVSYVMHFLFCAYSGEILRGWVCTLYLYPYPVTNALLIAVSLVS